MPRALVQDNATATLDDLHFAEVPLPTPAPDELRVRVHAVGLNPVDYKRITFGAPSFTSFPHTGGLDAAGVVDAIGSDVTGFSIGDRVVGLCAMETPHGGFGEYALMKGAVAAKIPASISFVDAAALPVGALTAYQILFDKLHIERGKTLLITAAAGGVGGFAVQMAKHAGLTVLGTCSARNAEYVRGLGADHTIDYTAADVVAAARELTRGEGVDYIFDCVGSDSAKSLFPLLRFGGHVASIAGPITFAESDNAFLRALSLHHAFLGRGLSAGPTFARRIGEMMAEVLRQVEQGRLRPTVSRVIPLDGVVEGLHQLADRHVVGKIVAKVID